jgi:hypothetical protein|nr:MAG: hypothetical protein DIU60_24465 [Actinomycetota bacterium]
MPTDEIIQSAVPAGAPAAPAPADRYGTANATGFDFELVRKRLRRRERRRIERAWTGVAGPYGEVTLTLNRDTGRAELSCAALPETWVSHPDGTRQGCIVIDQRTRLVIGGQEAELIRNRWGLRREKRALHIRIGDRHYSYLSAGRRVKELREARRGPVARIRQGKNPAVTVSPGADAVDLSLALVLQGTGPYVPSIIFDLIYVVVVFLIAGGPSGGDGDS